MRRSRARRGALTKARWPVAVLTCPRAHLAELFSKLDYAGAERALQLALEQAGHFGTTSGPVATSLLNLAQLYRRAGRLPVGTVVGLGALCRRQRT